MKTMPDSTRGRLFWVLVGVAIGGLVILIVWSDLYYQWTTKSWYTVGFTDAQRAEKQKSIWDWLDLLLVPLVLAGGGLLFSRAERRNEQAIAEQRANREREIAEQRANREREIAEENAQEAALQAYLEQMSTLLIDKGLRKSAQDDEARAVARAWTLTVLHRLLKGERKGVLLRFLYESGLIMNENNIVSLERADLRGAVLTEANLKRTNLRQAYLVGAHLEGAILTEVNLERASLRQAYLVEANLERAHLAGANLREAYLVRANLREADLMGAHLVRADLMRANLSHATYDASTKWPEGFNPEEAGAVFVKEEEK